MVFNCGNCKLNTGCPKKKYTSLKSSIFVLRSRQSTKLVSFVRQVLSLDFDTLLVKIGQKLTELRLSEDRITEQAETRESTDSMIA